MTTILQYFVLFLAVAAVATREIEPCICFPGFTDCSFRERSEMLKGEICDGTTKVNLRGNLLRVLPDGLKTVVELDASNNIMKRLPNASKLGKVIRILDLSANEIADASEELAPLSSLEELIVRGNRLTTLGFLPKSCALQRLDASTNALTDVDGPLRGCDRLQRLLLTNNDIASLPDGLFARLGKLEVLDLKNNALQQVRPGVFHGLRALKYLRLTGNNLDSLPAGVFSDLHELRILEISDNPLAKVSESAMNGLKQLESLTMSVQEPTALPSSLFANTTQLRKLALEVKGPITLPRDLFKPLSNLDKLDLLGSHMSDLPLRLLRSLAQLKTLNLYGSRLHHLPEGFFSGLHSLRVVDLRANRLTELPELMDCCEGLWYVDFSENNISAASETALRALLRGDNTAHLRENPLRPSQMLWALRAADVEPFVDDEYCACGGLRRGNASVDFCVDAPCGDDAEYRDWIGAVAATGASSE